MKEAIARAGCERQEAGARQGEGEAGFLEVGFFSFVFVFFYLLV